jgi:hypothetical protein
VGSASEVDLGEVATDDARQQLVGGAHGADPDAVPDGARLERDRGDARLDVALADGEEQAVAVCSS